MGPRSYSHICLLSHLSVVPSRPLQLLACPRHGDGAFPYMANASSSLVVKQGLLTVQASNHSPACFTPRRARHCGSIVQHHLCFAFFFAASDINFHISGHTSSGREVFCFLVSLHPDHVYPSGDVSSSRTNLVNPVHGTTLHQVMFVLFW